jgi:hypothetical protein
MNPSQNKRNKKDDNNKTSSSSIFDSFKEEEDKKKDKPITASQDLYNESSFSENYGNNIFLVLILTIGVAGFSYYMQSKANSKQIAKNWATQRCKPQNIVMAGFIHPEPGKTASQTTADNFNYCVNEVLRNIVGSYMQPFNYLTLILTATFEAIGKGVNDARALLDKIRAQLLALITMIFNMVVQFLIPLQKIIYSINDMLGKTQGILTTGLFTMLCVFYAMIDSVGALMTISGIIIVILYVIVCLLAAAILIPIVGVYFLPMFIATFIPYVILVIYFLIVIALCLFIQIEVPVFCFDGETPIVLESGATIPIKEVQVGDVIKGGNYITATLRLDGTRTPLYRLNDVIVSGSHYVQYKDKWLQVQHHPAAEELDERRDTLYSLQTSKKEFLVKGTLFSDWDDLFDAKDRKRVEAFFKRHGVKSGSLISGFHPSTRVLMANGISTKAIQEIETGDLLYGNHRVNGIITIDGTKTQQLTFSMDGKRVQGGAYWVFRDPVTKEKRVTLDKDIDVRPVTPTSLQTQPRLFHLLVQNGTFTLANGLVVYDYNSLVDTALVDTALE